MASRSTVFRNGRLFTGTDRFASCLAVSPAGLIEAIGQPHDPSIVAALEANATPHDLKGRVVVPGFIDAHMHFMLFSSSLSKLPLESCVNLSDIRSAVTAFAAQNPGAPRLLCLGWRQPTTDGVALASMLDDLPTQGRPVFIDSKDLHSTWCNTAALKELGVYEPGPDPAGGKIHRGKDGKASGLLSESASHGVWEHLDRVVGMEEKVEILRRGGREYTRQGYTGVVEMAMDETQWVVLRRLVEEERGKGEGGLPLRVAAHWLIRPSVDVGELLRQVDRAKELMREFNGETSPGLRIAGVKIITDGVIDSCTAAVSQPYGNGVECPPLWEPKTLELVVKRADAAGLQCALHAIGDGAIKMSIDTLAKHGSPGMRHRIEHLELTAPEDAKRLGKLGITASIQPVHSDPSILRAWPKLIGEKRCERAFAYTEFAEGGATLALGTDAPTAPYAPLRNLYVGTTRRSALEPESEETVNKHFALALAKAMAAATEGAAYSCFAENLTGKLEKGLKADFAVLDMEWDAEKLLEARVVETWFEGRRVWWEGGS